MDCDNRDSCLCVKIIPMRKVVEESRMRNMGMLRRCGEDEIVRRDCPITLIVVGEDEEGTMQEDAIISGISSKEAS